LNQSRADPPGRVIRACLWVCVAVWIGLQPAQDAGARNLTVFAAASLKNAMDDVSRRFEQISGDRVSVSYAATSALARQIENGAPADVFISADIGWMDYVARRNLIVAGSRVDLLRNELVLISPSQSTANIQIRRGLPLAGLLGNGRLAMADPDYVPAGKYGKAALESLGVWSSVSKKIARGENVRTALNFVARGEAPLGIVYRTDAEAERSVRIVAVFPPGTHPPIIYPAALLIGGGHPDAMTFLQFLKSKAARSIFAQNGFLPY